MRISSSTLFEVNVTQLNTLQSNMLQTQQQLSTGRRMLTPADDPTAAARALQVTQSDGTNTQYISNMGMASDSVSLSEGTLQSVTSLLQTIQTTAVQAGDPALAAADRATLASTLKDNLNQLTSLANTKDSVGNYLFSGFKGSTQPFVNTSTGVQYNGDDGQRLIQVSSNRQIAASDSGANIFMRIKDGNGTFVTQPSAGNVGSGTVSLGSVTDPSKLLAGHVYQLKFDSPTSYQVVDTSNANQQVLSGNYVSGQSINFNGIQFDIQGAPAKGDTFNVSPSTNQSVFTTISNLITTLSPSYSPPQVSSNASNTGNGLVAATISNSANLTGSDYSLTFDGTNYNLKRLSDNTVTQYATLPQTVDGLNISLTSGTPKAGDGFVIHPVTNALNPTQLSQAINEALGGLSNSLNNVLTTRASLGSRLNELDALKTTGTDLGLQFKQTLSSLQDVDYNKAISDLTQQQTMLTAAQKSFVQVQNLTMFNYMP